MTTEYGCCFNTLLGELLGRRYEMMMLTKLQLIILSLYDIILCSNEVDDQIEYAIFTREMYELCGISSGGFCTGV